MRQYLIGGNLRVLLVNQAFYPDTVATAQHTTDLALYLKRQGYEVSVLCSRRAYAEPKKVFSKFQVHQGIRIYRTKGTGLGKQSFLRRIVDIFTLQVAVLGRLLFLRQHDVVIAFTSPPLVSFLAMVYCRFRGATLISWLMDINPDAAIAAGYLKPNSFITRCLVAIFRLTLAHSKHIVVLDRWMGEKLAAHGVKKDKVIIIPPWDVQDPKAFDRPNIRGPQNPFSIANALQEKFVILYSGNLSIVHPLTTLLDAAVQLQDDESVSFVFVGGGLGFKEVVGYQERFNLKNILRLPYQPRDLLPYSLSCADVHVITMGREVAGFVHTSKVYGTLMTGVPFIAVAPPQSHLADLVKEVPGGFLVEHGDAAELLSAIKNCRAMSAEDRVFIRKQQREYLHSYYSLEGLLHRFESVAFKNQSIPAERLPLGLGQK